MEHYPFLLEVGHLIEKIVPDTPPEIELIHVAK